MSDWKRGDVVTITDEAHPRSVMVLTSEAETNRHPWLLMDESCMQWYSTEFVENRSPVLIVRGGSLATGGTE